MSPIRLKTVKLCHSLEGFQIVCEGVHSCKGMIAQTQIPIHHHPTKDETFIILRGRVRVSTYNDQGEILESCIISHEDGMYGVDIPKNTWHSVECLEPSVLLECKEGPFVEHEVEGILKL